MGKTKTLIINASFDVAKKSHKCQANSKHQLTQGSLRLKVKNGLGFDYYCSDCAKKIFDIDIQKLTDLRKKFP